jgi:hypothetical protein
MGQCICGREHRVKCPSCDRFVRVVSGEAREQRSLDEKFFANHEIGVCMGSHMEYKNCPKSGKPV